MDKRSVQVPDIGDFQEVEVIDILVQSGDRIQEEDPLITLESDKASMDVPSPFSGTISSIHLKVGDKVSEGNLILELEEELLDDEKEVAEHLMLIDLGRNDVGRISKSGSVEVTEKMIVERYSHVMHITSNVTGNVQENLTSIDIIKAVLPAGTLSGAPKIRAMEIIDEVEPVKRNIYGGAVGYLGWNNNMDMAIAIRTAVVKDNVLHVQAGGGVVADSDPQMEWEETMNKARAIIRAAESLGDS